MATKASDFSGRVRLDREVNQLAGILLVICATAGAHRRAQARFVSSSKVLMVPAVDSEAAIPIELDSKTNQQPWSKGSVHPKPVASPTSGQGDSPSPTAPTTASSPGKP